MLTKKQTNMFTARRNKVVFVRQLGLIANSRKPTVQQIRFASTNYQDQINLKIKQGNPFVKEQQEETESEKVAGVFSESHSHMNEFMRRNSEQDDRIQQYLKEHGETTTFSPVKNN